MFKKKSQEEIDQKTTDKAAKIAAKERAATEKATAKAQAKETAAAAKVAAHDQKAADKAAKAASTAEAKERAAAAKAELAAWRNAHPAEKQMNSAAMLHMWPKSTKGRTGSGPVKGGQAELFDANAHKAWTATRLGAGVATGGATLFLAGRKNKGAAAINVVFGNGNPGSYTVKPEALAAANRYVTAFNALAAQLESEG